MNVFVSTCALDSTLSLTNVLDKYSSCGIKNVELTSGRGYEDNIFEKLSKYNFNYLVHNYFPEPELSFVLNYASLNEDLRKRSIDRAYEGIKLSSLLGSPHYTMHAGFLYDPDGSIDKKTGLFKVPRGNYFDKEKALDNYVDSLTTVYNFASSKNVKLLIENNVCARGMENKLLLSDYEDFKDLFEKIGDLNVGILLDFGHLKVSSTTLGFPVEEFIKKLNNKISAFHVHDNDGFRDSHGKILQDSWIIEELNKYSFKKNVATLEVNSLNIEEVMEQKSLLENI